MRNHAPLVAFTLLVELAAGGFAVAHVLGPSAVVAAAPWLAVSAALAALGIAASLAHLATPTRALAALRGVRRSWLSREALLCGLFVAAALAHGVLGPGALGWTACGLGILSVGSIGAVYGAAFVPLWRGWFAPLHHSASALVLGTALLAVPLGPWRETLAVIAASGVVVQWAALEVRARRLERDPFAVETRAEKRLRYAHTIAGLLGAASLLASPFGALTWIAVVLLAVGQLLGRAHFYAAGRGMLPQ
jgi:DMSO reductase anchor subunit